MSGIDKTNALHANARLRRGVSLWAKYGGPSGAKRESWGHLLKVDTMTVGLSFRTPYGDTFICSGIPRGNCRTSRITTLKGKKQIEARARTGQLVYRNTAVAGRARRSPLCPIQAEHHPYSVYVMRKLHLRPSAQVQQEQSLHEESRMVGGTAHVFCGVYGSVVVAGPSPLIVVAFTRTGIAAPVLRLKTRCPRTARDQHM